MAKKQSLNYGPNTALIQGAGQVASSQAMLDSSSVALVTGFTDAFGGMMKEKKESEDLINKFAEQVKIPDNIQLVDESNRQQIIDFTRGVRSRVIELGKQYQKTKDPNIMDEIQLEQNKLVNLRNQMQGYTDETKIYLDANDKGQILRGDNFDFKTHDKVWSRNSTFNIEENGDIGFNVDGNYNKYNDISGKWNTNNNIYGEGFLKIDETITNNATKGGVFSDSIVRNNLRTLLQKTGPEGVQTAAEMDIAGDDSNLSFKQLWASGGLDDSFYAKYPKPKDSNNEQQVKQATAWMFDNQNSKDLSDMLVNYGTNVLSDRHDQFYKADTPNIRLTQGERASIASSKAIDDLLNKKGPLTTNDFLSIKLPSGKSITQLEEDGITKITVVDYNGFELGDAVDINDRYSVERLLKNHADILQQDLNYIIDNPTAFTTTTNIIPTITNNKDDKKDFNPLRKAFTTAFKAAQRTT
jgi:hypothetical protein